MPNRVFRDDKLEKEFNQKGYAKVPFLSGEEIEYLKKAFFDTIAESGGPRTSGDVDFDSKSLITYDFTFIDRNSDYKRKVFDIITTAFQKRTGELLNNYRPIIANFIRKKQDGGEVPMHQNWAFVDEEHYTSVSVWVPLVDSNVENGTLQMVDGSHKRFGKYRGPMVPWELRNLKEQIVSKHLTPMNVKAGEGVILDDSIVHYSDVNKTPGLRLAIQLIMVPAEAPTIHYHLDRTAGDNKIHMLETDSDFYMEFHPWLKPTGKKELATIPYHEADFSYQKFIEGLAKPRFDEQPAIQPLFADKALQEKFDSDGYVKVSLLNAGEVKELKDYYDSQNHDHIGEYGFHISLDNLRQDYINGVFKKLFDTLTPKLDPLLKDYKAFTASYVIKEAGLQNIVPPHQDWSFVDEEKFCSATVWVPLVDVNKNNGALGIIKGSHKLFNFPRTSPSPQAKSLLSDHVFTLFPYVDVIDMKAGEALIFNNKTIHASPPNVSGATRIAAGIGITQKNAALLHYYQLPGQDTIEVYEVDGSFFPKYSNKVISALYDKGEKPVDVKKILSYQKNTPAYTKDGILQLVKQLKGLTVNTELMKELAAMYNYNMDGSPKQKAQQPETVSSQTVQEPVMAETPGEKWTDNRTFFEKYTPSNILAEIKYRLSKN
jgi:ectoine hydroxylase-related dioxygenase (phytanoyl-CoA dioxygenase family)